MKIFLKVTLSIIGVAFLYVFFVGVGELLSDSSTKNERFFSDKYSVKLMGVLDSRISEEVFQKTFEEFSSQKLIVEKTQYEMLPDIPLDSRITTLRVKEFDWQGTSGSLIGVFYKNHLVRVYFQVSDDDYLSVVEKVNLENPQHLSIQQKEWDDVWILDNGRKILFRDSDADQGKSVIAWEDRILMDKVIEESGSF